MVGRDPGDLFPRFASTAGEPLLRVQGLQSRRLTDIGFTLRRGEVLGLGGLIGQGQEDLLLSLFGAEAHRAARLALDGGPVAVPNVRAAARLGIAYVPSDRKVEGLHLPQSLHFNLVLPTIRMIARHGLRRPAIEKSRVAALLQRFAVRGGSAADRAIQLSGGNQQKIAIAKWLPLNPRVLLLNDPTRGVDVETKRELYLMLRQLAAAGTSIILASSDTPELVELCDRVLVLADGRVRVALSGVSCPRKPSCPPRSARAAAARRGRRDHALALRIHSLAKERRCPRHLRRRAADAGRLRDPVPRPSAPQRSRPPLADMVPAGRRRHGSGCDHADGRRRPVDRGRRQHRLRSLRDRDRRGRPRHMAGGIVLVLLAGAAVGAVTGLLVTLLRLPPIIVTLATSFIWTGVALLIMPIPGGSVPESLSDALAGDVPTPLLIVAALAVLWKLWTLTPLGFASAVFGDNPAGAFRSGIDIGRARVAAYALSGVLSMSAGLFLAAQTGGGDPTIGTPYTLNSITAAVLGGIAFSGGAGTMRGALAGAMLLTAMISVMFLLGISAFYQYIAQGVVILIAMALPLLRRP